MDVLDRWFREYRWFVRHWCEAGRRRWFGARSTLDELESLVWYMLVAYEAGYVAKVVNVEGFLRCRIRQYLRQEAMRLGGFVRSYPARSGPGSNGKIYTRKARVNRVRGVLERFGGCIDTVGTPEKEMGGYVVVSKAEDPAATVAAREVLEVAIRRVPPCYRNRYANVARAVAAVG